MDELDDRLQRESAGLRARAAAVAQTDAALHEVRMVSGRHGQRWSWMSRSVAAASLAAAAVVGFVVVRHDDGPQSVSSDGETNLAPAAVSQAPATAVDATPPTAPTTTTTVTAIVTTAPTSDSTSDPASDPTTAATLSSDTPFDRCDYSDPGQWPSHRDCPDVTQVEVTAPVVVASAPIVVGEPMSTIPEALIRGVVSIEGPCVYLTDPSTGGSPVIVWPAGTAWDGRRGVIVLVDGQTIDNGATIDGAGGWYSADNVPGLTPTGVDKIIACLPPGTDQHSADAVVLAFPERVTPPVPITPTS